MKNLFLLILVFNTISCKNKVIIKKPTTKIVSKLETKKNFKQKDTILSTNIEYINDSILRGKFKLNISKYVLENSKKGCNPTLIKKEDFFEYSIDGDQLSSKKFKNLGDLNNDKKDDYVFILPSLGSCEEGQSYYFNDNKIPRIVTESTCCHIESVFSLGDIDEDGGNEIAEYNSSCASNFKVIKIWTLKKGKWKLIDDFLFYFNNGKYKAFKDFHKLYRKISKNKLKFLEISDLHVNGEVEMEWKMVTIE